MVPRVIRVINRSNRQKKISKHIDLNKQSGNTYRTLNPTAVFSSIQEELQNRSH